MKKQKTSKFHRKEKRYFSEEARKAIVQQVEQGLSKAEAARRYNVSQTSIHKWIRLYSDKYQKTLITVVEHQSDSHKNKLLEAELSKAYESLGRAQTENMLLHKIIELASEHFETDLKKTFENKHLPVSIKTKKNSK